MNYYVNNKGEVFGVSGVLRGNPYIMAKEDSCWYLVELRNWPHLKYIRKGGCTYWDGIVEKGDWLEVVLNNVLDFPATSTILHNEQI